MQTQYEEGKKRLRILMALFIISGGAYAASLFFSYLSMPPEALNMASYGLESQRNEPNSVSRATSVWVAILGFCTFFALLRTWRYGRELFVAYLCLLLATTAFTSHHPMILTSWMSALRDLSTIYMGAFAVLLYQHPIKGAFEREDHRDSLELS